MTTVVCKQLYHLDEYNSKYSNASIKIDDKKILKQLQC